MREFDPRSAHAADAPPCRNDRNECSREEMEEATMKRRSNNHEEPGGERERERERERWVLSKQNTPQRERKYTTNQKRAWVLHHEL